MYNFNICPFLSRLLFSSCTLNLEDEFSAHFNERKTARSFSKPLDDNTNVHSGQSDSESDCESLNKFSDSLSEVDEEDINSNSEEPAAKKRKAVWSDEDDEQEEGLVVNN